MAATRCGSAITHSRCTTPHSSRISVAGAAASSASSRIVSMRRCGSAYTIKSRGGILHHYVIANPVLNCPARARVNIVLWRVAGVPPAFLHDNQVVWVCSVILFLHRRRYLVVRLGQHAVKRGVVRVVAKSAERVNLGHGVSAIVF